MASVATKASSNAWLLLLMFWLISLGVLATSITYKNQSAIKLFPSDLKIFSWTKKYALWNLKCPKYKEVFLPHFGVQQEQRLVVVVGWVLDCYGYFD